MIATRRSNDLPSGRRSRTNSLPRGRWAQKKAARGDVKSNDYNRNLSTTIVAALTSKLKLLREPVVHLVDPADSESQAAGLLAKSLIR